jgi:uncharacterized protein (TIGR02646 family)
MRKFERALAPQFLEEKWKQWGREWKHRLAAHPNAVFHWHELGGQLVNHRLLPPLKQQVQDHCSFCDNYPVSPPSNDTIEHFRPKARFPRLAYHWKNLYYCCDFCQGKEVRGEEFDKALLRALLRPDAADYTFDRYFRWDYTRGHLEVNETASPEDQRRAEVTLKLYRLNDRHPSLRLREQRRRFQMPNNSLDDFAYRDFVGPLPPAP